MEKFNAKQYATKDLEKQIKYLNYPKHFCQL